MSFLTLALILILTLTLPLPPDPIPLLTIRNNGMHGLTSGEYARSAAMGAAIGAVGALGLVVPQLTQPSIMTLTLTLTLAYA